jgi:hypothetical protein
MNSEDWNNAIKFDRTLEQGGTYMAHWTNCGRYYTGRVQIIKLNEKSVRVSLLEAIRKNGTEQVEYPIGQKLVIPRATDLIRWSVNNRLEPLPERHAPLPEKTEPRDEVFYRLTETDILEVAASKGIGLTEEEMLLARKYVSNGMNTQWWEITTIALDEVVDRRRQADERHQNSD